MEPVAHEVRGIALSRCAALSIERKRTGRLGMRLTAEMYNQIVEALRSDSQGEKDKRREPRVGLAGEAPLVSVTDDGKRIAGTVRVRDVSRSGIGLIFNQKLANKQRFVVQLQHADDQPLWLVCFTAYCRAIDGGRYTIGARIEQVLRTEQIRKLEQKNAAAAATALAPMKKVAPLDVSDIARISKAILG